jgi:uncharacterized protein YvpB
VNDSTDRRAPLRFRSGEEKQAAVEFAVTIRGFDSLNAYFMYLYRQDKRQYREALPSAETQMAAYNAEAAED